MKFCLRLDKAAEEYHALSEVLTELGHVLCDDGVLVSFEHCEKGVRVFGDGDGVTIQYADRTCLMRGAGLLCRYSGKGNFCVSQSPAYDTLGTMPDVSRNAVLTVDGVKRLCRYMALMGFNSMLLYTEDTYEVDGEPFFGHMRGRYSAAELREMDDYANLLGIEIIPCIQTLAHLETIFRWPAYKPMLDVQDILNVSNERIYELIEHMIASMTKNLRSRRINIGMDEAFLLGRGAYLVQNGYHPAREIMLKHLGRVVDICKKYGQQPRMWSDMFFRMATPDHTYRNPTCNITEEIKDIVPPEITLVFWAYIETDRISYDRQLENHQKFNNDIAFAGGDCGWYSLVPLNSFSVTVARAALESVRERGIKEVYVTMWRNSGMVCSYFAELPTLVLYAEDCWSADTSTENLREAMRATTNCGYDLFMDMEQVENLPCRQHNYGVERVKPSKSFLWQDMLCGRFDAQVPSGAGKHYAACCEFLRSANKEEEGRFGYIFDTLEAYCHVLELKAEAGVELKNAYDEKNTAKLAEYRDIILPELLKRMDILYDKYCIQWRQENRDFGWETQDIRFGGLFARIKTVIRLLDEYLTGKRDRLEELEAERLLATKQNPIHGLLPRKDDWCDIVTLGYLK